MSDQSTVNSVPVSHRTRQVGRPRSDEPGYLAARVRPDRLEYHKEMGRQRTARRHAARSEWRDAVKASHGCQMCGEHDPACLEFHHINPETFAFSVGGTINHATKSRLLEELAKCAVVCSNCHKKAHRNGLPIDLDPIDVDALPPIP